jgi:hypothetical protein
MNTWWLAIDKNHTSYEELKSRKVVAQGWPQVGDLRTLCPLATNPAQEVLVKNVVGELATLHFGEGSEQIGRARKVMWNLLQIRRGDLVVGIEGTRVRGICQVGSDATASYRYDPSGQYNYAQTVCADAQWIDWNNDLLGVPPATPNLGILGVQGLVNDSEKVIAAWSKVATSENAQTAFDIIEYLGNEMDLMNAPQKSAWKAYLTSLAYAKLKAAGYIYEKGSQEFIKVWDNQSIPFVIHMRLAGIDDAMEEGEPGAYGCRRELEEEGISPSQPAGAR